MTSRAGDRAPAPRSPSEPARRERLEDLTRAARRGDRTAFERLVVETAPQVHALALRLTGNEQDARDVVQETYLRAFRSIGRFRSEAAVSTWLYRIAANCSADQLRRRRQSLPIEAALSLADDRPDGDPEAAADGAADRSALVAALAELPDALRAVVVLHDVYELGHEAIGVELGISRAASKVRLHRARRRLREQLFPERHGTRRAAPAVGTGAEAGAAVHGIVRRVPSSPGEASDAGRWDAVAG